MRIEWWIFIFVYITGTGLLFLIPKHRIRHAVVGFLFLQIITFILGLVVVELGLLEYPVRLFASINRASFTYEYYAFPVVFAVFYVRYPENRSTLIKFGYYAGVTSVLTILEVIIEKYTELINYIHWAWYTSWITIFLTFYLAHKFCNWFFKNEKQIKQ